MVFAVCFADCTCNMHKFPPKMGWSERVIFRFILNTRKAHTHTHRTTKKRKKKKKKNEKEKMNTKKRKKIFWRVEMIKKSIRLKAILVHGAVGALFLQLSNDCMYMCVKQEPM